MAELPATSVPPGATKPVRDPGGNHWTLVPDGAGNHALHVLPAQAQSAWIPAPVAGLGNGRWHNLEASPDGQITVRGPDSARRFDFRFPARGATEVTGEQEQADAAESPWRVVARFPAGIHDITAAVVENRMYVAGGLTSYWGFPAKAHAYDALFVLDENAGTWQPVASLPAPRIYAATAGYRGKVWVIGGDVRAPDGQRHTTAQVDVYDPATGQLTEETPLPFPVATPLALTAADRLWVVGSSTAQGPGHLVSRGAGESRWRREPDGPKGMMALAGAALADKLYVCIPGTGLVSYDPATREWQTIREAPVPRSPQIAAWGGELWVMGGAEVPEPRQTLIFNPGTQAWRIGPQLPKPLAWGAAAVVSNRLILAGGAALHGQPGTSLFDFEDRTWALTATPPPATASARAPRRMFARWSDEKLRGTGSGRLPYTTRRLYPQLTFGRPTQITSVPNAAPGAARRRLVVDYDGDAWTVPEDEGSSRKQPFLHLTTAHGIRTSLQALAFHPRFPAEPYVYVLYNRWAPKPAENVLARFQVDPGGDLRADSASEHRLLVWPSDGHNGGDVRFGPDGFLYLSTGDRGPPGDPHGMGQRVDVIAGGILRLDVDRSDPGLAYAIPPDNPFLGLSGVRPEFWAYGLRNPWRMAFSPTGELWVGDNGEDAWESIHLIRKGYNYGWSAFEGAHPFRSERPLSGPIPRHTPPVVEMAHTESRSIIGGLVYRGSALPELKGHYVFGDYVTGLMWAFQWDGTAARNLRRIADTRSQIISFGEDRAGEILLTRDDGQIHRLVSSPDANRPVPPVPSRLSETGLFASTAQFTPAPEVVPYAVNAAMWSNGAVVQRWLAISSRTPVVVLESAVQWSLPDGTALVRTLTLPTATGSRRVETQVMYRDQSEWRFYTYAWNAEQTDADLVKEEGETRPVLGLALNSWRFSGRAECTLCHRTEKGTTLAISTPQLNRLTDFSSFGHGTADQIHAWRTMGLVHASDRLLAALPRKADPTEAALAIEARARAYLDVNCAHCHQEGGLAGRASFRLADTVPLADAGLLNAAPLVPLLGPEARLVKPGQPGASELLHRMLIKEGGRMPLVGNELTDEFGVDLIRRWILQLPADKAPAFTPPNARP